MNLVFSYLIYLLTASCCSHKLVYIFLIRIKETVLLMEAVLVLAGVEFIFSPVANIGLCFRFVLGTVLRTRGCFSFC